MSHTYSAPVGTRLRSHIPSLDGIRGVAVLMVIVHHFAEKQEVGHGFTRYLLRFSEIGWGGVDLFFVLSGFLITGILIEAKNHAHPIRTFYARRTLRIFPLYYLSLIGLIFIWPALSPTPEAFKEIQHNQAWYWTYLVNILIVLDIPMGSVNAGHFWSLAVEEQFYMFWPFVVLFVAPATLRRICIVMITGALVFRSSSFLLGWGHSPAYVLTISRVDALAMGALVCSIIREPSLCERLIRYAPRILLVACVIFTAIVIAQGSFRRGPLMLTAGLSVLAVIFALTVATAALEKQPVVRMIFQNSFLQFFGKYSYSMYIFHPFVMRWMDLWFPTVADASGWFAKGLPRFLVFTAVGLTLTSVIGLLSWNLFERWFLELKKHFAPAPATKSIPERTTVATS